MKQYIIFLFIALTILSCKEKATETIQDEISTEIQENLTLAEVLASNSKIKTGKLQSQTNSQKVKCTGLVNIPPSDINSIHSKIAGSIEYMKYLPGDYVKKGSLLFSISHPELVEKQRIFLETNSELWLAEKDLARKNSLVAENAVSSKIFDETKGRKDFLQARYNGLKTELEMVGINASKLLEDKKFQTTVSIFAPYSGYVQNVFVNKGQMISSDQKLMETVNKNHIHLELQVLAKDVPLLKTGQKVNFTLPKSQQKLTAKISKLNPILDETTGTLLVHCEIDEDDCAFIIPGMFVNANIAVDDRELFGLPIDAVIKEGLNYFAYIVIDDDLVKEELKNVHLFDNFITFDPIEAEQMIIAGAYYVE